MIELFAIYTFHGGGGRGKMIQEKEPMKTPQTMQMQIATFKQTVREIKKHSANEEEEWRLGACEVPKNRLKGAAVENRQAAIKGLPCLNEDDAEKVMRMV